MFGTFFLLPLACWVTFCLLIFTENLLADQSWEVNFIYFTIRKIFKIDGDFALNLFILSSGFIKSGLLGKFNFWSTRFPFQYICLSLVSTILLQCLAGSRNKINPFGINRSIHFKIMSRVSVRNQTLKDWVSFSKALIILMLETEFNRIRICANSRLFSNMTIRLDLVIIWKSWNADTDIMVGGSWKILVWKCFLKKIKVLRIALPLSFKGYSWKGL